MTRKNKWRLGIGAVVFIAVFAFVFVWKSKQRVPSESLESASLKINEIGYVGWQLMACVDDNQCPSSYDPQSALGLMPFVKMAEDQAFFELRKASQAAESLAPVLEAVQECSKYCSCVAWERFMESSHDGSFNMDLSTGTEGEQNCPQWSELSESQVLRAQATLKYIESLQN